MSAETAAAAAAQESGRHGDPLEPQYRYDLPRGAGAGGTECTLGRVEAARVARRSGGALFHDTPAGRGDTLYREKMLVTDGSMAVRDPVVDKSNAPATLALV